MGLPPPEEKSNWVKDLIDKRYQPKTERLKRTPQGFNFKRDPFDPSSYYKDIGTLRAISQGASAVVNQEVANRQAAEQQAQMQAALAAGKNAMSGITPEFQYDGVGSAVGGVAGKISKKYHLGKVSSNVAKAANYWGSKYGITSIGGWREHGSVPGSDHPKGRALDFMINNLKNGKKTGTALANDVIKNYKAWNVKYVIWYHYIWSPSRGWRRYNGPSPHTDHVHVSFNK